MADDNTVRPMTVAEIRNRSTLIMTRVELRRILEACWSSAQDPVEWASFDDWYAEIPDDMRTDER